METYVICRSNSTSRIAAAPDCKTSTYHLPAVRSNCPVLRSDLCAGSVVQSSSLQKLCLHPLLFKTEDTAKYNEQR